LLTLMVVTWGSLLRMRPVGAGTRVAGAGEGMQRFRSGMTASCRAVGAPVTWVFSLYVVQAGSACPRPGRQACSYSVQPGW
jgi:hypothetical protein